jgi:enoyl-[acyl-carrier protein] reductase III
VAILVTGGSKGIGRAIALRFARPGNAVFINFHADGDAAAEAAREIEERGAAAHAIQADVSTAEGARELLARVAERTERLDQLVHCAVDPLSGPVLEVDPERFRRAVELNGVALVYLVQAALPLLGSGSTVFLLSSRGSHRAIPGYAALGAAKALGESLIRYLAVELAPRGVRANVVSPGNTYFPGGFWHGAQQNLPDLYAQILAVNPTGRMGTPEEVAKAVVFLSSPVSSFTTGSHLVVDGAVTRGIQL